MLFIFISVEIQKEKIVIIKKIFTLALCAAFSLPVLANSPWSYREKKQKLEISFLNGNPSTVIKKNTMTEIKLKFLLSGKEIDPKNVSFDAFMPDHEHGMMTKATVKKGNQYYSVKGVNLHMKGKWEFKINFLESGKKYKAVIDVHVD